MLTKFWKSFQSGTDIRGVAAEGVVGEEVNLTDEAVERIAHGFVAWLAERKGKGSQAITVALGHDPRISAERIRQAAARAMSRAGVTVLDCGLSSTPAMFFTTQDLGCDGAIEITASHHPFNRNGLKFFTAQGGLEKEDIRWILEFAQGFQPPDAAEIPGKIIPTAYMEEYCARLRRMIQEGVRAENYDRPLEGFHIVVDAGNGAGGFYASQVLAPLGADISGSQFLEPDGMFPNHPPNPENAQAMASVCRAVREQGADLGIVFDTDVDRGAAVDSQGREISRNRLVALASAIALQGSPGGTVVTDSITSNGVKQYIEQTLGGVHHRFKRGYKNVINEAIRLNREGVDCPLAIETSGHAAFRENGFLDDGAYLVTKILIEMAVLRREGKSLETLLDPLQEPVEAAEIRLPILEEEFASYGQTVIAALEDYARRHHWQIAPDNREGIRVSFPKGQGDGWFLLRLSVHDPILPVNVESDTQGGALQILRQLDGFLCGYDRIDRAPLEQFFTEKESSVE